MKPIKDFSFFIEHNELISRLKIKRGCHENGILLKL